MRSGDTGLARAQYVLFSGLNSLSVVVVVDLEIQPHARSFNHMVAIISRDGKAMLQMDVRSYNLCRRSTKAPYRIRVLWSDQTY